MSSKSRNRPRREAHAPRNPAPSTPAMPAAGSSGSDLDLYKRAGSEAEELVRVPKEKSKFKYYLTLGIILFTLLTFMSPLAIQQSFSILDSEVGMRFRTPGGDEVEYDFLEWKQECNGFDNALSIWVGGRMRQLDEVAFASFAISDRLARDAGIEIGEEELDEAIQGLVERTGGQAGLRGALRQYDMSERGFRDTLARLLRARRYQLVLGQVASLPDLDEIERMYREQHREYRFDTVSVSAADYAEQAAQEVPDADALRAWYDALGAVGQRRFETQPTAVAELGGYLVGGEVPQALLDSYPEPFGPVPEGVPDPAQQAKAYYDANRYSRFRRAEILTPEDVPAEIEEMERFAYQYCVPFEEVEQACRIEAPIHAALERWRADLAARLEAFPKVEDVDFAAEAAGLGLSVLDDGLARDREAFGALEGFGTENLFVTLNNIPEGALAPLLESKGALFVARVRTKTQAVLPPYDEILGDVEEAFAEERQRELAEEALEALRSGFAVAAAEDPGPTEAEAEGEAGGEAGGEAEAEAEGEAEGEAGAEAEAEAEPTADPTADEETFAAAATAAGLAVVQVDWFDRNAPAPPGAPEGDELAPEERARQFLRSQQILFDAREGAVPPPASTDQETWYLVRAGGERDGDASVLAPGDYASLRSESALRRGQEFVTSAFGGIVPFVSSEDDLLGVLRSDYGLYLYSKDPELLGAPEASEPGE